MMLSTACGNDCEGKEGATRDCRFFFKEDGTITPAQLELVQSNAIPMTVSEEFAEAALVEPAEQRINATFFSFPAEAGHIYSFGCEAITVGGCEFIVMGMDGRRLARTGLGPAFDTITCFHSVESGTHYAMVVPFIIGQQYGTFRYRLQDLGLDVSVNHYCSQ
ncbi:hypothetical protein ACLESD_25115 [Pyxidicoccus sp. 3LFB2]